MKFNILYLFWWILLGVALFLMRSFVSTSQTTIFGTADTQGQILNFEHAVVVKKIYVRTGSQVRKGDTLMLLQRPELERETSLKNSEIQLSNAEKQSQVKGTDKEIESLRSTFLLKINDLRSQIQLLEAEEKAQAALRKVVNNGKSDNTKSLAVEKINSLKTTISVEEQRFNAQLQELQRAKAAASVVFSSKENTASQEINFIKQARGRLVLLAPMNGFIENVFAFDNQIIPQYNQLLKINPQKPNTVKGFLPESMDVTYRLGDTVMVHSVRRPRIIAKAILIGSNPQLIELPMRLRKSQSASSWGRELYISLLPDNDFFIGEKMVIQVKRK
jgi:acetyl/propionyl-CoA carboxylase alpha subunit